MKLNELLNIEFPIIQGAMANISNGEFASSVSNAGGLGIIASGGMPCEVLRVEVKKCKALTNKPFGVNLMLLNPEIDLIAKMVIEEGVKVITTGAGNPAKFMTEWKEAGIIVIPVVPSVTLGKVMERNGADAVIAEGTESGGHVGEITTMSLVPQMVDALTIPVIAAGGVASGRQLAACLTLGAIGVQVGTCLLVSEECPIHVNYKEELLKAKDTATVVTGRSVGVPVRVIKNKMSKEYIKLEQTLTDKMELEKLTLGSLRKAVVEGDVRMGSLMAGQVAGMLKEVRPLRLILEELYNDSLKVLKSVGEDYEVR